MHIRTEFKVGLFVFLALLIFFVIVFFIGDFSLRQGYTFFVRFNFVNGLEPAAPVRLAGVKVGEVKEIKVTENRPPVEVRLWLKKGTPVERNCRVYINSLGLLGEKYVEISPGNSPLLIKPGETIIGCDPVSIQQLSHLGEQTIRKVDRVIGNLEEIVSDEEVRRDIKEVIKDSKQLSQQLNVVVDEASQSLANLNFIFERINRGEGTIGKLLSDEELYNEIRDLVQDIKRHPWKLFWKTKEKRKK